MKLYTGRDTRYYTYSYIVSQRKQFGISCKKKLLKMRGVQQSHGRQW